MPTAFARRAFPAAALTLTSLLLLLPALPAGAQERPSADRAPATATPSAIRSRCALRARGLRIRAVRMGLKRRRAVRLSRGAPRRRARALRRRAHLRHRRANVLRRGAGQRRRRCSTRLRRFARDRDARGSVIETQTTTSSPTIPDAGPLVVGVDGHYSGWNDAELADREDLGATVTRHEWDLSNPPTAEEQQVVAGATEVHTRIHALLGGNDLGDPDRYRDWVVDFVRYWGPGGSFWDAHPSLDESRYAITTIELGNEPYFGDMSPSEYAEAVEPALRAVAALDVPVKVVLPARVYGTDWIDVLYERIPDLNDLFDAFASHPYWYGHDPADGGPAGPFVRIAELREQMNEHGAGDKPIYITEYGESTAECSRECVSESEQADHLEAMLAAVAEHEEWDVEMLSFFQLRDRGTRNSDRERQFGLLRENGSPKPAYSIVRDAVRRYRG